MRTIIICLIFFTSCKNDKQQAQFQVSSRDIDKNHETKLVSNTVEQNIPNDTSEEAFEQSNNPQKKKVMELDQNLIGTWRYTEVISSGSGDFHASMTTDYFFQFKEDGTFSVWTGDSYAGNSDMTFSSNSSNTQQGKWQTEAAKKALYFTDLTTNQTAYTFYYVEAYKLMLYNNASKKVYERIN